MKEPRSKYAVLGMLTLRPMSGYDIRKAIQGSISNFWNESYGQIYPILASLEAEGLATRNVERQSGKPDRHVYDITEAGRKQLARWLAEPTEHQVGRVELLLKLFFGRQMKTADVEHHLESFRALQVKLLEGYDATAIELEKKSARRPDFPFWWMTLSYGRHMSRALIAWSDESFGMIHRSGRKRKVSALNTASRTTASPKRPRRRKGN